MAMPEDRKQQADVAMRAAWEAAEKAHTLTEANNLTAAVAWAANAQAWSAIAVAAASAPAKSRSGGRAASRG